MNFLNVCLKFYIEKSPAILENIYHTNVSSSIITMINNSIEREYLYFHKKDVIKLLTTYSFPPKKQIKSIIFILLTHNSLKYSQSWTVTFLHKEKEQCSMPLFVLSVNVLNMHNKLQCLMNLQ